MVTKGFEDKLKKVIQEIESGSAIEIVPLMAKRASSYAPWLMLSAFVFSYLPLRVLSPHFIQTWGASTYLLEALLWILLSFFLGKLLMRFSWASRLVPKSIQQERALSVAESAFLHEGVHETKERIGILIAVFEFEQMVIVLADKGFQPQITSDYWAKLGATLAQDFNKKNPGDEFFEALEVIQREVAPRFKLKGENPNELSDNLRRK